jgi:DNA-binding NarL/FixJ family response regulator
MTRILIADDSEVVRRGIRQLLGQHDGWEVCGEAADGQETIAKVRQLVPDVVVLDFAMPVMNGIEVARKIREERPNIAIVLCSMYFDRQLASLARNVGITSVLSKSNVGQVIKGVEAGLRGESFTESQI